MTICYKIFVIKYVYDRPVRQVLLFRITAGITRISRGNSMRSRSMTGKFSHRRIASGTRSRGDAAIIVQIKENVNSLSFASRVASGNIQQRQKEFVG